jgi:hypothetical protein
MSEISREETDARIDATEAEFRCRLDVAMIQNQSEFRQVAADLKTEVHRIISTHIKWVTGAVTAIVAAGVSIMTLILNNAVNRPPPTVQPPIVIAIPAAVQR